MNSRTGTIPEPLATLNAVLHRVPDWAHAVTLFTVSPAFHDQLLAEPDPTGMAYDYFTDTPTIFGIPYRVESAQVEAAVLWGAGGKRLLQTDAGGDLPHGTP